MKKGAQVTANEWTLMPEHPSGVVQIVLALKAAGIFSPQGLKGLAAIWQNVPIQPSMDWRQLQSLNVQTLNEMNRLGLYTHLAQNEADIIVQRWPYPLYSLEISRPTNDARRKHRERLKEQQRSWISDV